MTVRVLQDIREEIHGLRQEQREFRQEQMAFNQHVVARFEAIETALRDMAEQLVILGRGVKVAIETRGRVEGRLDDMERRLQDLEKRVS